jgi:branched-chain amino acid transport system substrate-binding protein
MKKRFTRFLSVALIALMLSGLTVVAAGADALPVIKIASCTPLSGSQSALGGSIKNGIEMALSARVQEFKDLGFDLQFLPMDDQADPKVGVSNAQRLVEDAQVLAVVGHYNSGVAIPSSEVYNEGGLTMVSPANTNPDVTDRGLPTVNRICARDDAQGPAGADFLFGLGKKTVFILQDKTTYGQGVADQFKKRFEEIGGTVKGYEGITAGEADFSAVEEMIRASGAEAVYFGGMYPEGALLIKQLKEKGINVVFLGPDGMDSAELVKIAGDAIIGNYYTSVAADVSGTEAGAAFVKKFTETYGRAPEAFAAYGYDAMNVALDGIKAAIAANGGKLPSREQVATATRQIKGFKGLATNVTFDEIGDNTEATIYVLGFEKAEYPPIAIKSIPSADYKK